MSVVLSTHLFRAMDPPSPFSSCAPLVPDHKTTTTCQAHHSSPTFDYTQRPSTWSPPALATVSTTNPHAIAVELSAPHQRTQTANDPHPPIITLPAPPCATVPSPTRATRVTTSSTLCPLCNTQIPAAYLADHLRLERKQLAGEPLTKADLTTLVQHGARPPAVASLRPLRRPNASPTPAKAKIKAARQLTTDLGQYKLLVEGVMTRRRARAATAAAAANDTQARSLTAGPHQSTPPPAAATPRTRRVPRPSAVPRQASRPTTAAAAEVVDPESDDWSSVANADLGSVVCPICARYIVGDELAVNAHVDACLANPLAGPMVTGGAARHASGSGDDGGATTDDDPDMYEPLPVAPPRPLPKPPRAGSGPFTSAGGHSPARVTAGETDNDADEDDELDIDADPSADRTASFGTAQFTELDVLPYSVAIHGANDLALQSLVAAASGDEDAETVRKRILDDAARLAERVQCAMPAPAPVVAGAGPQSAAEKAEALTMHALKERVVHLERLTQETPRCKVCWEGLGGKSGAPVVSVACWHIHCQECWLQSLGYRKVCPQCLVITRPEDLRKVYI